MKYLLVLVTVIAPLALFGTAANFMVNVGSVIVGSTVIDKSNGAEYTAVGILGDISSVDTTSLSTFQSGISSLATGTLSLVPIPEIPNVWMSAVDAGVAGAPASLLIYNNSNSAIWGVTSSSTFETLALGTAPLSFTTIDKFDTAVVGTYNAGAFTITTLAPDSLTGLVQVRYWNTMSNPRYTDLVEYHYYESDSRLHFLNTTLHSTNMYTWSSFDQHLNDFTFNEYFEYEYDTSNSGKVTMRGDIIYGPEMPLPYATIDLNYSPDISTSMGATNFTFGTFVNYPGSWDLDYDGTADGIQIKNGGVPSYGLGQIDLDGDDDGDGLTLAEEGALGTNPAAADTDGDGLSDGAEVNDYSTDPFNSDTSGDGLKDGFVVTAGFDPHTNYSSLFSGIEELRPGAVMLAVKEGIAALQLQIERSSDLTSWTAAEEDVKTIEIPIDASMQFFRFAMPQD
jgi:hypothetical protein